MINSFIYIIYLIFIGLGFGSLVFAIFKEKLSKYSIVFCIRTLLFWIVSGYIAYYIANTVSIANLSGISLYVLLIFNTYLFTVVFRPVFSIIVKKIRSQKKLMVGVQSFQYLAIIFLAISMALGFNVWIILLLIILYGAFYSLLVSEYLFFNDQYFFKINTFAVVYIITCIYGVGQLIGMAWQSLSLVFTTNILIYNILTIIGLIVLTSVAIYLTYKIDEDKSLIGTYDEILKSKLQHCSKKNIAVVCICALLISIIYAILNSTTFKIWLVANLYSIESSAKRILFVQNVFDIRSLFILACLTYPFYYFFLKKANANVMLLIDFFLAIISLTTIMLFKSIWVYLIFGYILNFCVTHLFYFIFSLSIVWFYRSNGIQLFNMFWLLMGIGTYLYLFVENVVILENKFVSLQQLYDFIENDNKEEFDKVKDGIALFGVIILLILSMLLSATILVVFFCYKQLIGDNIEINRSINILKKTIQESIIEKSKQPMEYELDIKNQVDDN